MAIVFFAGAETGDTSEFGIISGVLAADNTAGNFTNYGTFSYKAPLSSGNAAFGQTPTGLNLSPGYIRFNLKNGATASAAAGYTPLELLSTVGELFSLDMRWVSGTTWKLQAYFINNASNRVQAGSDFTWPSDGIFHCVEVIANYQIVGSSIQVYVDNNLAIQASGLSGNASVAGPIDSINFGSNNIPVTGAPFGATLGGNAWIDDICIRNDARPGRGYCIARQAKGTATAAANWSVVGTTHGFISEAWTNTPFGTASNCFTSTVSAAQTVTCSGFDALQETTHGQSPHGSGFILATDTVNAVKTAVVGGCLQVAPVAGKIETVVNSVVTDYTIAVFTATDSQYREAIWTTVPSFADLNSHLHGYLKGGPTAQHTIDDVWTMIDFTPLITSARVTRESTEIISAPTTGSRVTRESTEIISAPTTRSRVTRESIEIVRPTVVPAASRVTREAIEVLDAPNPNARVTRQSIEIVRLLTNLAAPRVTRESIELLSSPSTKTRVTRESIELLHENIAALFQPTEFYIFPDTGFARCGCLTAFGNGAFLGEGTYEDTFIYIYDGQQLNLVGSFPVLFGSWVFSALGGQLPTNTATGGIQFLGGATGGVSWSSNAFTGNKALQLEVINGGMSAFNRALPGLNYTVTGTETFTLQINIQDTAPLEISVALYAGNWTNRVWWGDTDVLGFGGTQIGSVPIIANVWNALTFTANQAGLINREQVTGMAWSIWQTGGISTVIFSDLDSSVSVATNTIPVIYPTSGVTTIRTGFVDCDMDGGAGFYLLQHHDNLLHIPAPGLVPQAITLPTTPSISYAGVAYVPSTTTATSGIVMIPTVGGFIMRSTNDGLTWTHLSFPGGSLVNTNPWLLDFVDDGASTVVAFGNGPFHPAGVGNSAFAGVWTSHDKGATWNPTYGYTTQTFIYALGFINSGIYANGQFVLVGENDDFLGAGIFSGQGTTITSSNGDTWTEATWQATNQPFGVAYGAGLYITAGDDTPPTAQSSSTGLPPWTTRVTSTHGELFDDILWNGSMFLAAGEGGTFTGTSTNGTTWTENNIAPYTPQFTLGPNFLVWDSTLNLWIMVASDSSVTALNGGQPMVIVTSPDGINFTKRFDSQYHDDVAGAPSLVSGFIKLNGVLYASLGDGRMVQSSDALTWTPLVTNQNTGTIKSGLRFLTRSGNNLIAKATDSITSLTHAYTSTDGGVTWAQTWTDTNSNWFGFMRVFGHSANIL